MKQAYTPTTTKVHYKLYKAGKFWLVGTLATVSLVAGLAVTNSAQADTTATTNSDATDSSVESETSSTDSKAVVLPKSTDSSTTKSDTDDTKTSNADETATPTASKETDSSDNGTSNSASNSSDSTNSKNTTQNSETESPANATATSTSSVQSTTQSLNTSKVNNVPAGSTTNVNNLKIPAQTGKSSAVLASSGLTVKKSVDSLMKLRLAPTSFKHTDVTPVVESDNADATTTDSSFTLGKLSNFYLNLQGDYLPYDYNAPANLYPYVSEHWVTGQRLFNFYVILPVSVTSTVADMQAGADKYVETLNKEGYISIKSLTVSELAPTAPEADPADPITNPTLYSRQVFYFQPDTNAHLIKPDTRFIGGTNGQPALTAMVKTTADTHITGIVANNSATNSDNTPVTTISNDVILAGIGADPDAYPTDPDYTVFSTDGLSSGIAYPDKFVVGMTNYRYIKTPAYAYINAVDSYRVYATGTTTNATTYPYAFHVATGVVGSSYNPTDKTSDVKSTDPASFFARTYSLAPDSVKSLDMKPQQYWLPSLHYVGTSDAISDDAVLPEKSTFSLTSMIIPDSAVTNGVNGKTFVYYIDSIKTSISPTASAVTIPATTGTWDPLSTDHLTFSSPTGLDYVDSSKLTTSEGNLTVKIDFTPKGDATSSLVSEVDTSKAGTYVVTYSYKDAQGNVTGTEAAPISTTLTITNSASISTSSKPAELVVGQDWNPNTAVSLKDIDGQSLVSLTDTDGQPVTPSADNLQVTSVKNPDESNGTTVNTDVPGIYTVTYTYKDSAGISHEATATVEVTSKSKLVAQNTNTTAGVKWSPAEAITSLTAANGTPVTPTDSDITVTNKDGSEVDTSKPGTYTVVYHYTDPTTKLDVVSDPVTLTITSAPTTGGTTTPDNSETPTTPTTPVKPTNPANTTKPAKTVRPVKPVTVKGVAIKDPPIRAIGEPQYTPGTQTGVTVNSSPLSGGEAAAALKHQNGQANPATVLSQAQADQLAADQTAAREAAARNTNANNANQQDQQNQLTDGTNATTLPQTNDQPATWTAQLGVLLLGLAGALGFRRKRN
ncbi:bacterial Ig-like domain-containing protein [Levilactobacillus wangkuiensis]|uniref:bacterial Ig-like domain-containing protein n=1 Tax=Levilactobacillus wangkuiensis TaxID=2799566 RepID=UPI0019407B9B|nr:bacterial Ig-like domain-containing protein [Levilactobacillus wangkuiensis]